MNRDNCDCNCDSDKGPSDNKSNLIIKIVALGLIAIVAVWAILALNKTASPPAVKSTVVEKTSK